MTGPSNEHRGGRGGGGRGRGAARGRGGYRPPALGLSEVPILKYGPNNNWLLFRERMIKNALERYGDLGRLIEDERYFEPPPIDRSAYDLINDPDGFNKQLLLEALKARQKMMIKMQNDRSNLYGFILGKLSPESIDELKRHSEYNDFNTQLDVLKLWRALKAIHMTMTTSKIDTLL